MITEEQLTNTSNGTMFGVMWQAGETGNTYQLINVRGLPSLTFGTKHKGSDKWFSNRVIDPSRYGLTEPPKSFAQFRTIALAYING